MAERKPLFYQSDLAAQGFHEEMAQGDTATFGGLTLGGDIAMGSHRVLNIAQTPTSNTEAASKKYVDDVAAGLAWKPPVKVLNMKSDVAQAGAPPVAPATGDAWVVNTWGVPYNDGDIVEWSGTAWAVIVANSGAEPPNSTRVLVKATGAAGSFLNKGGQYATYDSTANTWSFVAPADGDAVLVDGDGSAYENNGYTYTGSAWVQFTGAGSLVAGTGLDKLSNTLFVKYGDGTHDDGSGKLAVYLAGTTPGLEFGTGGDAGRLKVLLSGATLSASGGLNVLGLPSLFTVGGASNNVSSNVTHTNLNTLTGGVASDAGALHLHKKTTAPALAFAALTKADPVYQSGTTDRVGKARADTDAQSYVIGVAEADQATPGGAVPVIMTGNVAENILVGANPGDRYWLQLAGGIGTTLPTKRMIQVGFAKNATDLWVDIIDYGKKAA